MAPGGSVLDSSPPRKVNGQAVIFSAEQGQLEVLLQLRSESMAVMPGFLGSIGGCRSGRDADSRATALREVIEETGLQGGILFAPVKFAQGEKCDWFVMKLERPMFAPAKDSHECGDIRKQLHRLPPSAHVADCYGHAWVAVEEVPRITESLPLMGGLVGRIRAAQQYLAWLEARAESMEPSVGPLGSAELLAALQSSGIRLGSDGTVAYCPGEEAAVSAVHPKAGALLTQIEYYLSDQNLKTDRFFHEKISSDDGGWLQLEFIMACRKVQALGAAVDDVLLALEGSELVDVREDGLAIRRAGNKPLPALRLQARETARGGRGCGQGKFGFNGGAKGRGRFGKACEQGKAGLKGGAGGPPEPVRAVDGQPECPVSCSTPGTAHETI